MRSHHAMLVCGSGLLISLVVGCASGPVFEPAAVQDHQAVVYVCRPGQSYRGSAVALSIKVDDERVGSLANNGYTYQVLSPGRHEVTSSTESKASVPFEAQPGRSYYIEAAVDYGLFIGRPRLTMVPEEHGKLAIQGTRLVHSDHRDERAQAAVRG